MRENKELNRGVGVVKPELTEKQKKMLKIQQEIEAA